MQNLLFIIWNADPELFSWNFIHLRWYGLLFALGFAISQQILFYIHKKEGKPLEDVETLTVFMVIATIIGARLGHVFFYEPDKYLDNPMEILRIWNGGLASHGAAVGILIALWLYSRYDIRLKGVKLKVNKVIRERQSYLEILDRIVILVALTAVLIRVGNFINSEIEGKPTFGENGVVFTRSVTETLTYNADSPVSDVSFSKDTDRQLTKEGYVPIKIYIEFKHGYGLPFLNNYMASTVKEVLTNYSYVKKHIFETVDTKLDFKLLNEGTKNSAVVYTYGIARYPTQLYESTGYLMVFLVLLFVWFKYKAALPKGRIFGLFLILLFGLRILFEFVKENQVDFENNLTLNMGQLLSVPLVLAGVVILAKSFSSKMKVK